jgi:hypothetical protein
MFCLLSVVHLRNTEEYTKQETTIPLSSDYIGFFQNLLSFQIHMHIHTSVLRREGRERLKHMHNTKDACHAEVFVLIFVFAVLGIESVFP